MKSINWRIVLLVFGLFCISESGFSQKTRNKTGRKPVTKKATNKTKPPKPVDLNANKTNPAPAYNYDSLPVRPPVASMENDNAIERLLVKDRTPLAYEHLREDDAVYKQRVWRDIDVREKMNQPFLYDAEEDNGSQKFIDILFNAIQKDSNVIAYNGIDDRFTTPMKKSELVSSLVGPPVIQQVPDRIKDPTGALGIFKDSMIVNDFNSNGVTKFRIKEDWVFDKESSRMFVRILGIAPIMIDTLTLPGQAIEKVLFWVYYPKLRATLAKYEAYNGKNFGARPTWEELFEGRMFSSYIVKSTIDNPKNFFLDQIPGLKDNGILRLWEGENIKNKIFDYEQNLWSY
jgi:gliding motility associated protien GldN